MIELVVLTGWRLDELEALDEEELATLVDVYLERHGGRPRG
jgi:hypothetical protein